MHLGGMNISLISEKTKKKERRKKKLKNQNEQLERIITVWLLEVF